MGTSKNRFEKGKWVECAECDESLLVRLYALRGGLKKQAVCYTHFHSNKGFRGDLIFIYMPVDQLIASFGEFIPFIKTKLDVVLYNAFPFNLLKGLVIGIFTMLVYKKLTPILKGLK